MVMHGEVTRDFSRLLDTKRRGRVRVCPCVCVSSSNVAIDVLSVQGHSPSEPHESLTPIGATIFVLTTTSVGVAENRRPM